MKISKSNDENTEDKKYIIYRRNRSKNVTKGTDIERKEEKKRKENSWGEKKNDRMKKIERKQKRK